MTSATNIRANTCDLPSPKVSVLERHWLRTAIVLWVILTAVITVKAAVLPNHRSVYPAFTAGTRDFLAGRHEHGREGFLYGPTFATLFSPFAILPDSLGAMLWNWFNVAIMLYALLRFYREVLAVRWPQFSLGQFLSLTAIGAAGSLWSAQSNAAIISLILLAGVEIVNRRFWRAALFLAIPVHIKVWPIAAGMLLVALRPKALALRYVVCLAALAALPLVLVSPAYLAEYYGMWGDTIVTRQIEPRHWGGIGGGYRDGWTLWENLVGPVNKRVYSLVQLSAAALIFAWCMAMRYIKKDERFLVVGAISLWAAWQMLLGPGSERLTLAILAPVTAWTVLISFQQRQTRWLASIACALILIFSFGELERLFERFAPWAQAMLPLGILLLGVNIVWPHELISRVIGTRPAKELPLRDAVEAG